MTSHPAKFSPVILDAIEEVLDARDFQGTILDPFAGGGGIHKLASGNRSTVGIELEPEWASEATINGDCLNVMAEHHAYGARYDAIITSPSYGNRLADKDMRPSCAGTYMKGLGREASPGSSCHMQWGTAYRVFHMDAWVLATSLDPHLFILNIKDHYRGFERQHVAGWHIRTLATMGWRVTDIVAVPTPSLKYGVNTRRCSELVIVMEHG